MAKLTAAERRKIPTKVFGLPEKRKYPLEDEGHARAALSRAAANASPEEQKRIRNKVHSLYPGMRMNPAKLHSLASMAA